MVAGESIGCRKDKAFTRPCSGGNHKYNTGNIMSCFEPSESLRCIVGLVAIALCLGISVADQTLVYDIIRIDSVVKDKSTWNIQVILRDSVTGDAKNIEKYCKEYGSYSDVVLEGSNNLFSSTCTISRDDLGKLFMSQDIHHLYARYLGQSGDEKYDIPSRTDNWVPLNPLSYGYDPKSHDDLSNGKTAVDVGSGSKDKQHLGQGAASGGGVQAIINNVGDKSAIGEVEWSYKVKDDPDSKYIALDQCRTGTSVGQRVRDPLTGEYRITFSSPVTLGPHESREFSCSFGQDPRFPIPRGSESGPWIIRIEFLGQVKEIEWGSGIYSDTGDMGLKSCEGVGGECSKHSPPYICPRESFPLRDKKTGGMLITSCCNGIEKDIEGFSCDTIPRMNPCCAKLGSEVTIDDVYALYLEVNPNLQGKCEKDEDCLSFGSGPDNPEIGGCLIGRCNTNRDSPDFGKCYSDYSKPCQRSCYGSDGASITKPYCNDAMPPECKTPYEDVYVCESCIHGKYSWREDRSQMDCCFGKLYLLDKSRNWCNSGAASCDPEDKDYEGCLASRKGSCVHGLWYSDHCFDGIQNCDEEGIDCGGSDCKPCDEAVVEPEGRGSLSVKVYEYRDELRTLLQYCTDEMGGCEADLDCEKGIYVPYSDIDPVCEPEPYSGIGVRLYEVRSEQDMVALKDKFLRERNDGTVFFEDLEVGKSYQIEVTDWGEPISESMYWAQSSRTRLPVSISESGESKTESFNIRFLSASIVCAGEPVGKVKLRPNFGEYREWYCQYNDDITGLPVKVGWFYTPKIPFCDEEPPHVCDYEVELTQRPRMTEIKITYDPERCREMNEVEAAEYCGKTQFLRPSSEASERIIEGSQALPVGFFALSGDISLSGDPPSGAGVGRRPIGEGIETVGVSRPGPEPKDPSGGEKGDGSSQYWYVLDCSESCTGGSCNYYRANGGNANFRDGNQALKRDDVCASHFHNEVCLGVNRATPDRSPGYFGSEVSCNGCEITYKHTGGASVQCQCPIISQVNQKRCEATYPLVFEFGDYNYRGLRWSLIEYSNCKQDKVIGSGQEFCIDENGRELSLNDNKVTKDIRKITCSERGVSSQVVSCTEYSKGYITAGHHKEYKCWHGMCLPDCDDCKEGNMRCTRESCEGKGVHCEYKVEGWLHKITNIVVGHAACSWGDHWET